MGIYNASMYSFYNLLEYKTLAGILKLPVIFEKSARPKLS